MFVRLLENSLHSSQTNKKEEILWIEQDPQHVMISVKSYFQTHLSYFIMQKVFSLVRSKSCRAWVCASNTSECLIICEYMHLSAERLLIIQNFRLLVGERGAEKWKVILWNDIKCSKGYLRIMFEREVWMNEKFQFGFNHLQIYNSLKIL